MEQVELLHLPDEIILFICQFLDVLSFFNLRSVCRELREIINFDVKFSVNLHNFENYKIEKLEDFNNRTIEVKEKYLNVVKKEVVLFDFVNLQKGTDFHNLNDIHKAALDKKRQCELFSFNYYYLPIKISNNMNNCNLIKYVNNRNTLMLISYYNIINIICDNGYHIPFIKFWHSSLITDLSYSCQKGFLNITAVSKDLLKIFIISKEEFTICKFFSFGPHSYRITNYKIIYRDENLFYLYNEDDETFKIFYYHKIDKKYYQICKFHFDFLKKDKYSKEIDKELRKNKLPFPHFNFYNLTIEMKNLEMFSKIVDLYFGIRS